MTINIYAGWIAFQLGALAGAVTGLFFHRETWLGGYDSWRRRMIRLGHIAFFGLGLLNLSLALTAQALGVTSGMGLPSCLLIVAVVTMPAVCYLSACKMVFRHLFFIPAGSAILAIASFLWRMTFP